MPEEWPAAELFDQDYLDLYLPQVTDDATDAEAALIWDLLGLEPGQRVLDRSSGG